MDNNRLHCILFNTIISKTFLFLIQFVKDAIQLFLVLNAKTCFTELSTAESQVNSVKSQVNTFSIYN